MSLINDAIKQANQVNKARQQSGSPPAMAPTEGMQAAPPRPPQAGNSMTGMILIAAIVVFVLMGGLMLALSFRNRNEAAHQITASPAPNATSIARGAPPDSAALNPLIPPKPAAATPGATTPEGTAVGPDLVAGATVDAENEPKIPAPEPSVAEGPREFPALKLQGIYYRLDNPSVMINGRTLEIGDLVDDVKVIRIERKDVTVELDGRQKVLRLQ